MGGRQHIEKLGHEEFFVPAVVAAEAGHRLK